MNLDLIPESIRPSLIAEMAALPRLEAYRLYRKAYMKERERKHREGLRAIREAARVASTPVEVLENELGKVE